MSRRVGRSQHSLITVATALFGRAANLGGEIRHPEIRADAASAPAPAPE